MYEVTLCFSYNIEAADKYEAMKIAERIFSEETHPEVSWIDVNPISEDEDNCDDDCGFDPYLGYYTDDC